MNLVGPEKRFFWPLAVAESASVDTGREETVSSVARETLPKNLLTSGDIGAPCFRRIFQFMPRNNLGFALHTSEAIRSHFMTVEGPNYTTYGILLGEILKELKSLGYSGDEAALLEKLSNATAQNITYDILEAVMTIPRISKTDCKYPVLKNFLPLIDRIIRHEISNENGIKTDLIRFSDTLNGRWKWTGDYSYKKMVESNGNTFVGILYHRPIDDFYSENRTKGRMIDSDGTCYIGEFYTYRKTLMPVPEGLGEIIWPSKDRYVGEFLRGKPQGLGVYTKQNGMAVQKVWREGELPEKVSQIARNPIAPQARLVDRMPAQEKGEDSCRCC